MIGWLAKLLGSVFGLKVFMSGLFMSILGIISYNLVCEVIQEVLNFGLAKVGAVSVTGITGPSISGFAAWFAVQLRVPECVAVMVSFATLGFVLRKIPFLRW